MDYRFVKKSLSEVVSDFLKSPFKTAGILMLLLVLSLLYVAASSYVSDWITKDAITTGKEENSIHVASSTINQETTLTRAVLKEGPTEITYPVFNIPELDKLMKDILDGRISEFKYSNRDSQYLEEISRAGLDGSFETPYMDPNVISFRMHFCETLIFEDGHKARCRNTVLGINYDRKKKRLLTLSDALGLTGLSLEKLSAAARKQLISKNDPDFDYSAPDEKGIAAYPQNFSAFLIENDHVTFMFQQGQLFGMAAGMLEVSFPRIDKKY